MNNRTLGNRKLPRLLVVVGVASVLLSPTSQGRAAEAIRADVDAYPSECMADGPCRPKWNWLCYAAGVIIPIVNSCEAGTERCP